VQVVFGQGSAEVEWGTSEVLEAGSWAECAGAITIDGGGGGGWGC
jgi:hypothetical protein